MTRALHISDTHGEFPRIPADVDLILHTGDFCPNFVVMPREAEADAQRQWLRRKIPTIANWLRGRPMLVVQGNHDFTEITGPGVVDVSNREHVHAGLRFYGFPWVPAFGPWNWGASAEGLQRAVEVIPSGLDVLMCHAPPYGVLDYCPGGHIGNAALLPYLAGLDAPPRFLLCGHVHEQRRGVAHFYETVIMNNATSQARVTL